MNRRSFLTRVGRGAAAAVVLAHVPVGWVPQLGGARRCVALEYLRQAYYRYMSGRSIKEHPELIVVGRDLYEAAEDELTVNLRFGSSGYAGALRLVGV